MIVKKYFWRIVSVILAGWITKQGLVLRFFNYETIPTPNLDEYNYVWQAISLKKTGLPLAWTLNDGEYRNPKYKPMAGGIKGFSINSINRKEYLTERKPLSAVKELDYGKGREQILFVAPFFDHPPIGGLMYDWWMPKNISEVDQVKPADFRKSAIYLAVITGVLLFVLLFLIFGNPWIPLLSILIYSTVPTYVLATRTSYLENAVSPLVVASLIMLYLAINGIKREDRKWISRLWLILAGLGSGLAVLAKEPAIGFVIGFLILLVVNKVSLKNIFWFGVGASGPVLVYIIWGLSLQRDLFLGVFLTNAGRSYFGAIKMVTQLEALKFKNFPVDGWWIWGFLSFLIIGLRNKNKKIQFLTIPLVCHLVTVLFMPSPNYPWYLVSCIPFLAATSAVFIWQIIRRPNWGTGLAFFLIPFSSSYYWGRAALNLEPSMNHYRYIFIVFVALLALRTKFGRVNLVRYVWYLFFGYLMYRIFIYNQVFFPYLMAHWGGLPVPSLPNY